MDWKEGMKVTVKQSCTKCYPGIIYTLKYQRENNGLIAFNGDVGGCTCKSNWVPIEIDWEQRTKRGDLL
jgi:hypothetical protein